MPGDLLVIVPTRERRANTERFLHAFEETCDLPANLCLVLDDDDYSSYDGLRLPAGAWAEVVPRNTTAAKVNHAALGHADEYRAMMFLGDDNVCRTLGWDRQVMAKLDDIGHGMVYVNDLGGRENLIACNITISSSIVKALGYFDEPSMSHYCVDNVWVELGHGAGCIEYLPDVIIEHQHHIFAKAAYDSLYQATTQKWYDSDMAALVKWRSERKLADLETVREVMMR
jgi:hypothetical protein